MSTESVPQESLLETIERETTEVRNIGQVVLKSFQGLASLKFTVVSSLLGHAPTAITYQCVWVRCSL